MQKEELIKKYFYTSNKIVISLMYLKEFLDENKINLDNLKEYSPGHLGTSTSINFLLANLYYFLNENNLSHKLIIGEGHAGVSLISNLWLNGTLPKYNHRYSQNKEGLNNLIGDFGKTIRSEINPEYPETIYDGGELGYSLGVAYGYAINSNKDITCCIIGDGEAETGTLLASLQLNKLVNTKSKVLPIINLNGLKMGSQSYLSLLSDEELKNYFLSLGYEPLIIDTRNEKDILKNISVMQSTLSKAINIDSPIIIFKSYKGYTLKDALGIKFENNISVHKNPLKGVDNITKLKIISEFLKEYNESIFDASDNILDIFNNFKVKSSHDFVTEVKGNQEEEKPQNLEEYLLSFFKVNDGIIFSPDEIYSNMLGKLSNNTIEILNENLLQSMYQGYIASGGVGFYIAYEGFMPIISSMISQYYKYLLQKDKSKIFDKLHSLNYILTSTCFENTYSHQNPDFVNTLLEKEDTFYNILYPKDNESLIKCMDFITSTNNQINVITTSKRHHQHYDNPSISIEIIKDEEYPDLILGVTGDYMLDIAIATSEALAKDNIKVKIVYVTNPKLLDVNSKYALTETEFNSYFNKNTKIIYLFAGYASTIKSLLYDRDIYPTVLGYNDKIAPFGSFSDITKANNLQIDDIIDIYKKDKQRIKRR